nr:hypothetical protein [Tanacetum cinerariifolium]
LSDPIEHVADEAVYKELDDSLVRATTTASSLEAEQDSGNIDKTQSKATPNEASSLRTTLGGGPMCQDTMRDTIALTRSERVSKHSNDSLLARGNTLQSDEDRMKLNELMGLCINLQTRVLDLEKINTTQALEITSLKRRVKKLENKQRSRTHKLKRLYKVGLTTRVDSSKDEQSLEVSAAGKVNTASIATTVSAAATITTKEITLAQALVEIKTSKPKAKGIVLQEPSESITTTTIISSKKLQDKDGFDKEERIAREKDENKLKANIALIEEWDDIQAKIDKMFDRVFNRVNTFVDFRIELVEGSSKRAGEELTQESAKKQKVVDDKKTAELKQLMKIIPDEEELRKFWCIVVVEDPNPPEDESEVRPLKKFIVNFTIKNGKKSLALNFKTFVESTGLDYNEGKYVAHPSPENGKKSLALNFKTFVESIGLDYNEGKYVAHPSPEVVKAELAKITTAEDLLIVYCLLKGTKVDIREIIYSDLITRLMAKSRQNYVSYPRFVSCALKVLLGLEYAQDENFGSLPNITSPLNFTRDPSKVTPIELAYSMIAVNNLEYAVTPFPFSETKKKKKNCQTMPPKDSDKTQLVSSGQNAHPQDTKGFTQPTVKGFHSPLDDGTCKSQPLLEVEMDNQTLLLTTIADIQALLVDSDEELKDDSEYDV